MLAVRIDCAANSAIIAVQDQTGAYRRLFEAAGYSPEWSKAVHDHFIATMRYGVGMHRDILSRFVTGEKSARDAIAEYAAWYATYIERSFSFPKVDA
jgi:hypothetical protein